MYRAADIVYEEGDGGIDGVGECKANGGAHSPPVPKAVPKKAEVCNHLNRCKVSNTLSISISGHSGVQLGHLKMASSKKKLTLF